MTGQLRYKSLYISMRFFANDLVLRRLRQRGRRCLRLPSATPFILSMKALFDCSTLSMKALFKGDKLRIKPGSEPGCKSTYDSLDWIEALKFYKNIRLLLI